MSLNCIYAKIGSQLFCGRPSVDRYNKLHCTVGEMSASARMFVVKKKQKRNPFPLVGTTYDETNRTAGGGRANSGSKIRSTRLFRHVDVVKNIQRERDRDSKLRSVFACSGNRHCCHHHRRCRRRHLHDCCSSSCDCFHRH